MNLFQWAVAPLLLGMATWHAWWTLRNQSHRSQGILSTLLWGLGGLMILRPDLSQTLAHLLGIGRGTDLVLYSAVIAGLFAAFAQYRQNRRLEIMITEMVRHVAIENSVVGERGGMSGNRPHIHTGSGS